ncbi:MAG: hypothetical protein HYY41_05910, partial [Chloroflexi bacterium]|nr:hypothetical protein [Chloroflexota bacterium]
RLTEIVRRGRNPYISSEEPRESIGLDCSFSLVEVPSREKIISYVVENASNMVVKQGFNLLLGLQDLFPNKRSDKVQIMNSIDKKLQESPMYDKISVVLAIMETEAWFLCDWRMFERIDAKLTNAYIHSRLGLDIANNDPELVYNHPSKTLDEILKLADRRYRKHSSEIDLVVGSVDVTYLSSCTDKIDSFFSFIRQLDSCVLSP